MSTIGYHTRLYSDNSQKLVGGSAHGSLDMDTINKLVNGMFGVVVKPSGTGVFVDKNGREVNLYVSVDAGRTDMGRIAVQEWRSEQEKREASAEERRDREKAEIGQLMEGMSHEEIVARLRKNP